MAIRHGNKTYLQILLDPHRAELLKQVAESKGVRPTAWIREAVYMMLEMQVQPKVYRVAAEKDEETWRESVRKRVEGRMKNKRQSEEPRGDMDNLG
jgi:hypothetical protein